MTTLPNPDFYLARVAPGQTPSAVAARIAAGAGPSAAWKVQTFDNALAVEQSTLASLDLAGLGRIEVLGASVIAALGVAVLGAFVVLERRREAAILRSMGATTAQLLTSPALESLSTVAVSLGLGIPLGLGMATLSTRVLTLLFSLPPPGSFGCRLRNSVSWPRW